MFRLFLSFLTDLFRSRASLEAEIVGLPQQVAVLKQRLGSPCWPIGVSGPKPWGNRRLGQG
jgi:hypothetical protein